MAPIPKAPKENYAQQAIMVAVGLVILGVVLAILTKFIIGAIVTLLGLVFGIGNRVTQDNPLEK